VELFGLVCSLAAAFLASVAYAAVLQRLRLPHLLRTAVLFASLGVLACLLLECTLPGKPFEVLVTLVFLFAIPAPVNLLVIARPDTAWSSWLAIGTLSAALAIPLGLTNIAVSEALYGVDGEGGPYSSQPNRPGDR
jgi:hypothetical protein